MTSLRPSESVDPLRAESDVYVSTYAHDAEMIELVRQFVQELPGRMADLQQAAELGGSATVARLAHQLKGAGGSHGFSLITQAAAAVEQAAAADSTSELPAAIERLKHICSRARSAPPVA